MRPGTFLSCVAAGHSELTRWLIFALQNHDGHLSLDEFKRWARSSDPGVERSAVRASVLSAATIPVRLEEIDSLTTLSQHSVHDVVYKFLAAARDDGSLDRHGFNSVMQQYYMVPPTSHTEHAQATLVLQCFVPTCTLAG